MGSAAPRAAAQWLQLIETTSAESEIMDDDGLTLERLSLFRFPILAMYGDNSQAHLTGTKLLEVWPHAEFRRMRDAGHFFPASRPDEVVSCCERFWAGDFADGVRRHRAGEARRSRFRSDRVFRADGVWYVATRENPRVGPFGDYRQSCDALARLVPAVQA